VAAWRPSLPGFNDDFVTLTQCERRSDYRSFKSGPFGLTGVLSFAVVLDMPSAGLAENSIACQTHDRCSLMCRDEQNGSVGHMFLRMAYRSSLSPSKAIASLSHWAQVFFTQSLLRRDA
jgi:hypothetical protein